MKNAFNIVLMMILFFLVAHLVISIDQIIDSYKMILDEAEHSLQWAG